MFHFRIPLLKNPARLPLASEPEIVTLEDGSLFHLHVSQVRCTFGSSKQIHLLAFNGSIPGPALKVRQGARISVHVTSAMPAALDLKWHGLVSECSAQAAAAGQIGVENSCVYQVSFPEPGVYTYQAAFSETPALPAALYGSIIVIPQDVMYWPPVNKEYAVIVDELILDHSQAPAEGYPSAASSAQVSPQPILLLNGENPGRMAGDIGEVIRLYLTNVASCRIIRFGIPAVGMKQVGGERGRLEREEFLEEVLLPPGGRAVIDVMIERSGLFPIEQRSPQIITRMGTLEGDIHPVMPSYAREFRTRRENPEFQELREIISSLDGLPIDRTLMLVRLSAAEVSSPGKWSFHSRSQAYSQPELHWDLPAGKRHKLRLLRAPDSANPAPHPVHFYGRPVLVLSRNHVQNANFSWQDTILLNQGEIVDLLIDNTGRPVQPVGCSTPLYDTYL